MTPPRVQWAKEKQMYAKMRISRHRRWCWWRAHCRLRGFCMMKRMNEDLWGIRHTYVHTVASPCVCRRIVAAITTGLSRQLIFHGNNSSNLQGSNYGASLVFEPLSRGVRDSECIKSLIVMRNIWKVSLKFNQSHCLSNEYLIVAMLSKSILFFRTEF